MEIEPVDRISRLPAVILHDILSLLPRKDAARTCVLSKQWSLIWESYPILDFEQDISAVYDLLRSHNRSAFTLHTYTFLSRVKNFLIKSSNSKLVGYSFRLSTLECDLESSSKVNECFDLALKIGIPEIEIMLDDPSPMTKRRLYFAVPRTMLGPITLKYLSLKKLSLYGIVLSEKWIHCAVQNCPNICYLSLQLISGLQKLHISKLNKLAMVSIDRIIGIVSVDIVAPKLQVFDFRGVCRPCAIDLSSCRDLRKLRLDCLDIKDDVLHCLISKFPMLEYLTLDKTRVLGRVLVSGTNLRRVNILRIDESKAIEINAPALLSYRFEGEMLPRMFFKRVPSRVEIVFVLGLLLQANTLRFVHLREFLASFSQVEVLRVELYANRVTFNRKELKRAVVPALYQLDRLELTYMGTSESASFVVNPLIEGLLWSAHPKRISVTFTSPFGYSCIKLLCEFLSENDKRDRTCCASSRVKCWRHQLKSVRVESVGEDAALAKFLDKLLMSRDAFYHEVDFKIHWLDSDAWYQVICLKLEWDDSIY